MNAEDADPREEELASWLAACDEALEQGLAEPSLEDRPASADLDPRLQRDLVCVYHLRRLWRPGSSRLPAATGSAPTELPATLGRFRIQRELGRGGYGIVYLAYDPRLNRDVALKIPRGDVLLNPDLHSRFRQEARAAAGLDHPNVVPVFEAGEIGPVCYIASAYCPGITLADWLRQRTEPLPITDAAQLVAALADGVQHAHSRGVLHRDLKPSNILLAPSGQRSAVSQKQGCIVSELTADSCSLSAIPKITDFGWPRYWRRASST